MTTAKKPEIMAYKEENSRARSGIYGLALSGDDILLFNLSIDPERKNPIPWEFADLENLVMPDKQGGKWKNFLLKADGQILDFTEELNAARPEQAKQFFLCLQSPEINKIMRGDVRDILPENIDIYGAGYVNIDQHFRMYYQQPQNIKGGSSFTLAKMLFDILMIHYTNEGGKNPRVRITLKKYMEMRGLKDAKSAAAQVRESLKILKQIGFTAEAKSGKKWVWSGFIGICGGTAFLRNGIINFNFNTDFLPYLERAALIAPMDYPKEILQVNPKLFPHAFDMGKYIATNYRLNEGKKRCSIITTKSILPRLPAMPIFENLGKEQRNAYQLIIDPFLNNLDCFEDIYYDFVDADGKLIESPDIYFKGRGGWDRFITSKLIIDYSDYPKHKERVYKRDQHKAQAAKAKRKKQEIKALAARVEALENNKK